ncbi:vesicle-trafficking protein SEC22b-like [Tachypleus tridentatus]|uniref:vesicle-trafficking protein SEC22b-like n=1 Tax=Tachypleus tridentatus TaxID=6853 RepID=UPI003FD5016C
MVLMTMIARLSDGLPLAASVQEDEQSGQNILEYQNQAKMLFRKLNAQSPPFCSIETGPYMFHYFIKGDVCYLALCEKPFLKRLAFAYLEDLHNEFSSQYGNRVTTVSRPYSFIEFDTYIQKSKKFFMDFRSRRNLSALNIELQDVQRIMVKNIDDVLQRGSILSDLDTKSSNLAILSQKYKKDAHYLNLRSTYVKAATAAVIVFVMFIYFWLL